MQKIIIDTNVVVSALIQKSYPYRIIYELFVDGKFLLCLSDELLAEYYEVLSRPKFAKFPDFFSRAESLLADIENRAQTFLPTTTVELISDEADNMILELAEACNADFIITGNTTDFTMPHYKSTKIVTPKEYWNTYLPV